MGLKHIIKRQRIINPAAGNEMELPGEPLIYSLKQTVGSRMLTHDFFRNQQWSSLLKCHFPSYYRVTVPVVLMVKFYVTPPPSVHVSDRTLKAETMYATRSFEVCDYLLSFLEMIMHVLINSYRQVVKIEVDKFYSSNPRTVFKFMKLSHYVKLYRNTAVHPASESLSQDV